MVTKKGLYMDTIAAIASPPGEGAVAIIRISGDRAVEYAAKILRSKDNAPFVVSQQRYMALCYVRAQNVADKVMFSWAEQPATYTGEQTAEIYCHGGRAVTEGILRALLNAGCRQAEAGEFTLRAFLNGKLDLTAAEGVIDLIQAQTQAQIDVAFKQSEGELYEDINKIFDGLNGLAASVEASIDYPEEDVEEITKAEIREKLSEYYKRLSELLEGYGQARLIREGVRVVLSGPVNVGKSSIMNAILKRDRAIVTSQAGTTRDVIEESYCYKGVKFVLCDTAGIREVQDEAEREGIKRAVKELESADVILRVTEKGKPFDTEIKKANEITVINKNDLKEIKNKDSTADIEISALNGHNIEELKELIYIKSGVNNAGQRAGINNLRQYEAAKNCFDCVDGLLQQLDGLTMDVIMSEIERAARELGKITGKTASEEIINSIFARFCVGK